MYGLVEDEDGETQQVILGENSQTVTETYRIEDNLVCGVVETVVEGENAAIAEALAENDDTSSESSTTEDDAPTTD